MATAAAAATAAVASRRPLFMMEYLGVYVIGLSFIPRSRRFPLLTSCVYSLRNVTNNVIRSNSRRHLKDVNSSSQWQWVNDAAYNDNTDYNESVYAYIGDCTCRIVNHVSTNNVSRWRLENFNYCIRKETAIGRLAYATMTVLWLRRDGIWGPNYDRR